MAPEKKTVGLMTMSNVINFGSVLQTYATVISVEKAGGNCVLIDYKYPSLWHTTKSVGYENKSDNDGKIGKIKKILKRLDLLFCVCTVKSFIIRKKKAQLQLEAVFQTLLSNVNKTGRQYNRKSILKNPPEFDIYMTGSDQTWNPRYLHTDYSFLLNFAPENAPKIAYSASFGAKKMLPEYRENYIKYLRQYDRISVRESTGVSLVKELTGKDATHIPDPTLMLDKMEWKEHVKNKLDLPEKFIFCYILNYVFDPYPELIDFVEHLAAITKQPVVILGSTRQITNNCIILSDSVGPEGFLECFDKASFVVTTSFHGTAFSVNFEKDFFAVLNPNVTLDDRVKSFLESVDLSHRGLILSQTDIKAITLEDMKTDHTESAKCLQKMRSDSMAFLTEALQVSRV